MKPKLESESGVTTTDYIKAEIELNDHEQLYGEVMLAARHFHLSHWRSMTDTYPIHWFYRLHCQ